jgi:protein involved in ribonucleotide reduction
MKKIFLFLFIIFISCTKNDSTPAVKSLYVLENSIDNNVQPSAGTPSINLIKDGKVILTIDNAIAKAMAIDKNNSYIIGLQDSKAKLWKNGIATELTNFSPSSISLVGNDINIFGFGDDKNSGRVALLWKNGTTTQLNYPDYSFILKGFLFGNDLCTYGTSTNSIDNPYSFIYSINGKQTKVIKENPTKPIEFLSAFILNGDVYFSGLEANDNQILTAKYWKNSVETILGNGNYQSLARSIFVSGNDVYAVGYEYNSDSKKIARLWKNGIGTNLTENLSDANLVFVAENDVYVAGSENGISRLWKNGIAVELPVKSGEFISVIVQ